MYKPNFKSLILALIISPLITSYITGCSQSSSSSNKDIPTTIEGYWYGLQTNDLDAISKITSNSTHLYQTDKMHNCSLSIDFRSNYSANTYTFISSSESIDFNYKVISENSIEVLNTKSGEIYQMQRASESAVSDLQNSTCSDPTSDGQLAISIEFEKLNKTLLIGPVEEFFYSINIWFDMDQSGTRNTGDYWVAHQLKVEDSSSEALYILENVAPLLITFSDEIEDNTSISSTGTTKIENNILTLTFDRNSHQLFREITNATPIAINAKIEEEIGTETYQSRDTYPDTVRYNPIFTNGIDTSLMDDLTGDLSNSDLPELIEYNTKLDIKTIEISITDR